MNRRDFLSLAAGGAVVGSVMAMPLGQFALAAGESRIKAVAFDAFPILDPRPAFAVIKQYLPQNSEAFRKAWFAKIFSYTWLRTAGEQYKDFEAVMKDALDFTAEDLGVQLAPEAKASIVEAFFSLPVWSDVKPALNTFKEQGIKVAFLSNMTEKMLRANLQHNGIEEYFTHVLSTDSVQAYKPAPKAYQLGVEAFKLPKEEIAFAAFAGWDAAGAKWFGYPTVWMNRLGAVPENLEVVPDVTGKDMESLTRFIST